MPSAGAIRAGRAFVEIFAEDSQLQRTLNRSAAKLEAFGASVQRIGRGLLLFGGAGIVGFSKLIAAASDAQETLNRFQAVFGDQANAAGKFADDLARAVGRSRTDIQDALASFQGFFVGLGFGSEHAREMSQTLERLALDFASFNNLSDEEAVGRFISALSGSSEVLDKFGINIKAAAIEQQLLANGIKKSSAQASEQEKAIARLQIIMKSMTEQGAVGDAIKTQGSFANQLKRFQSTAKETAEIIGQAVLPTATRWIQTGGRVIQVVRDWARENEELAVTAFKLVAGITAAGGALVVFGGAATAAALAIKGLSIVSAALAPVLAALLSPAGLVTVAVAGLTAAVFQAVVGFENLGLALKDFGVFSTLVAGRFEQVWIDAVAGVMKAVADLLEFFDSGLNRILKANENVLSLFGVNLDGSNGVFNAELFKAAVDLAAGARKAAIEQRIQKALKDIDAAVPEGAELDFNADKLMEQIQEGMKLNLDEFQSKIQSGASTLKQRSGLEGTFSPDRRQLLLDRQASAMNKMAQGINQAVAELKNVNKNLQLV